MTAFVLQRLQYAPDATFGRLESSDGTTICVTLELPNKGNAPDVSCIPAGQYTAVRYLSPKRGYDVWLLQSVPGRTYVEMHIGDTTKDTDGCILLGSYFGFSGDVYGIVNSKTAFNKWMTWTKDLDTLTLTILDPRPGTVWTRPE